MTGLRASLPAVVLVASLFAIVPLQNWIDNRGLGLEPSEEILYFADGAALKRAALGYEALLADIYWMRAIQYFGNKVISNPRVLDSRSQQLALLYPMVDVTTTLDPHYIEPYRFGGYFVHDYVDPKLGIELLEKAVRNNPDAIYLYQDLAFLHWTEGNCSRASELYRTASERPNAPYWMKDLAATILANCGGHRVTIQMLTQLYETTEDPRLRQEAAGKLQSYVAYDEVLYLTRAAAAYRERAGSWPQSLSAVVRATQLVDDPERPRLRIAQNGIPVDPAGVPYEYDPTTGTVRTAPNGVELPQAAERVGG